MPNNPNVKRYDKHMTLAKTCKVLGRVVSVAVTYCKMCSKQSAYEDLTVDVHARLDSERDEAAIYAVFVMSSSRLRPTLIRPYQQVTRVLSSSLRPRYEGCVMLYQNNQADARSQLMYSDAVASTAHNQT